jgi:hypothetical protein
MSPRVNDEMRQRFAAIADVLIPASEGMPAASEVQVQGQLLDRILGVRQDLAEPFFRGMQATAELDAETAARQLNELDPEALTAIGLIASGGYYMTDRVRELIGYPGQESRPESDPDATPEYVENGMLRQVIDRGPIYRSTPDS